MADNHRDLTLVIADKNYCLWPLAPWLCLKFAGLEFREILIRFGQDDTRKQLLEHGPTGRVPVLHHGKLTLWDSLAICEYVADLAPKSGLRPQHRDARAVARSFACEMHSAGSDYPGAVRHIIFALDTNVRRRTAQVTPSPIVQAAIDQLIVRWRHCRAGHGEGGPFLFGTFSIADAMSAHLVNRMTTYAIHLPDDIQAYCDTMCRFGPLADWAAQARAEDWKLQSAEIDLPDAI